MTTQMKLDRLGWALYEVEPFAGSQSVGTRARFTSRPGRMMNPPRASSIVAHAPFGGSQRPAVEYGYATWAESRLNDAAPAF
jgi:hypothetical protein